MNDARLDRHAAGGATGDARPAEETAPNRLDQPGGVPARDWSRTAHGRSTSGTLLHWIDEKGAVVRLLTSSETDAVADDT
jgi:hypothetical protein